MNNYFRIAIAIIWILVGIICFKRNDTIFAIVSIIIAILFIAKFIKTQKETKN